MNTVGVEQKPIVANKHYFRLNGGLIASLESDTPLTFASKALAAGSSHVPGFEYLPQVPPQLPELTIQHKESDQQNFWGGTQTVEINDRWGGEINFDFFHLLYSMHRLWLLEHNLYPVHSICFGNELQYILAAGHSGAGKTSTLLQMVQRYGSKVFSTNKTVVSLQEKRLQAVGGTKLITVRPQDTHRVPTNETQSDHAARKAFFLESNLYAQAESVPIAAIALLRLNDGVKEAEPITDMSKVHTLFPYFLDVVHESTIVGKGAGVFPGGASREIQQRLAAQLVEVLPLLPVISVVGSIEFVTETLARGLEAK